MEQKEKIKFYFQSDFSIIFLYIFFTLSSQLLSSNLFLEEQKARGALCFQNSLDLFQGRHKGKTEVGGGEGGGEILLLSNTVKSRERFKRPSSQFLTAGINPPLAPHHVPSLGRALILD